MQIYTFNFFKGSQKALKRAPTEFWSALVPSFALSVEIPSVTRWVCHWFEK